VENWRYKVRTYSDVLERLNVTLRGHGLSAAQDMMRSAIQTAYSKLPSRGHWSWFLPELRISVSAPYSTGLISYSATTNRITLSAAPGGAAPVLVLPTWVANSAIVMGNYCYRIDKRISDTVASLDASVHPTESLIAQAFVIYNDRHQLPSDFAAVSGPVMAYGYGELLFTPVETMPNRFGLWPITASPPSNYTIMRLPTNPPSRGMGLWPLPSTALIAQMVYERKPRAMLRTGHDARDFAGKVTIDDVYGVTTITGTSTTFTPDLVGSVLRVGSSTELPSGIEGLRPYYEELTIDSYVSPTELTAAETTAGWTGVHYTVSDPVDATEDLYQLLLGLALGELSQIIGKPIPVNIDSLVRTAKSKETGYVGPTLVGQEDTYRQSGVFQMRGNISQG
jgi:hypothetical protein